VSVRRRAGSGQIGRGLKQPRREPGAAADARRRDQNQDKAEAAASEPHLLSVAPTLERLVYNGLA